MTNITAAQAKALAEAFATISEIFGSLSEEATKAPAAKTAPAAKPAAKAAPAKTTPAKATKGKPAPVVEDDEDEDDEEDTEEDDEEEDDDELDTWTGEGMTEAELRAFARSAKIADLRAILKDEHGLSAKELATLAGKTAVADKFVELVTELNEDGGLDYEDDEDVEDDEDETDEYDEMSLRELRAAAKTEGYGADRTKGLDRDALIALLRGDLEDDEDEEEDDDEDLDEDDADDADSDEDTDEDEEEEYDPDTMSDAELRKLARENGIKLPRGASREKIIEALFE